MKAGDIVRQKVTGWGVVLLKKNWKLDIWAGHGEWVGRIWIPEEGTTGHWEERDFHESELSE